MIKIGNNNKIYKTIIGYNNKNNKGKNNYSIIKDVILPIIVGLIIACLVFLLGWN